jgi:hypothetical protein
LLFCPLLDKKIGYFHKPFSKRPGAPEFGEASDAVYLLPGQAGIHNQHAVFKFGEKGDIRRRIAENHDFIGLNGAVAD